MNVTEEMAKYKNILNESRPINSVTKMGLGLSLGKEKSEKFNVPTAVKKEASEPVESPLSKKVRPTSGKSKPGPFSSKGKIAEAFSKQDPDAEKECVWCQNVMPRSSMGRFCSKKCRDAESDHFDYDKDDQPKNKVEESYNVAAKVRARKDKEPEKYCKDKKCLYRTDDEFCPKHKPAKKEVKESVESNELEEKI